MGITEDLADALAKDTIAVLGHFDDEEIIQDVARVIGAGSVTTQEAYLTAARVRLSEKRGRDYLIRRVEEAKLGKAASAPPPSPEDDIEY
ncbi:hypothetical protein [Celeribacter sp.]|uniref:hypothetical protein n=1 Tax=Celeribacter sp. TaxID=1890673 RepID=UPI003A9317E7